MEEFEKKLNEVDQTMEKSTEEISKVADSEQEKAKAKLRAMRKNKNTLEEEIVALKAKWGIKGKD